MTRVLHSDHAILAKVLKLRRNRPKNQKHSYPTTNNTIQVLWIKNHTFILLLHFQTYIVGASFFDIIQFVEVGFLENRGIFHIKKSLHGSVVLA
jgi:hypothetical protein